MFSRSSSQKFTYRWFSTGFFLFLSVVCSSTVFAANFSQAGVSSSTCQQTHPSISLSDFELGGNGVITVNSVPNSTVYLFGAPDNSFLLPEGIQIGNFRAYLSTSSALAAISIVTNSNGLAQVSFPIQNHPNLIGLVYGFQAVTLDLNCFASGQIYGASALSIVELTDPQSGSLPTASQFTVDGITFTTSEPRHYGFYANGDIFIKGPATITSVSGPEGQVPEWNRVVGNQNCNPGQWAGYEVCQEYPNFDRECVYTPGFGQYNGRCVYNRVRNGMELNHTSATPPAFDSRTGSLPANPPVTLPVTIGQNHLDSLILTISQPDEKSAECMAQAAPNIPYRDYEGGCTWATTYRMAVVTVGPEGSIPTIENSQELRPPYPGNNKQRYFADNIVLPPAIISPFPSAPSYEVVLRRVQNSWLTTGGAEGYTLVSPANNMKAYGAQIANTAAEAMLTLMRTDLSYQQRRALAIKLAQIGIDYAHAFWNGANYAGTGGHSGSGGIFRAVFAGSLLNDQAMLGIGADARLANEFSPTAFTYYDGNPNADYYLGVLGMPRYAPSGMTFYGNPAFPPVDVAQRLLDPARDYFACCSIVAWSAEVLAMRMAGLESYFPYPAMFDMVDRFVDEGRLIGAYHSPFAKDVWNNYMQTAPFQAELCSSGTLNKCQTNCDARPAEPQSLTALVAGQFPGSGIMLGETSVDAGPGCGN